MVAVVVLLVVYRPGPSTGSADARAAASSPANLPGGQLLVFDNHTGDVGRTDLGGRHFRPLEGDSLMGNYAVLSPDQSLAMSSVGTMYRLQGDKVTLIADRPPGGWTPASQPWADESRRVVQITVGGGHADVRIADIMGGRVHSLGGGAADAVGDPVREGALVMVAGKAEVSMGDYAAMPSTSLELRTPGHRTPLATTAGLARQIGLPTHVPYQVGARFSPDGQLVAVTLDQLRPGSSAAHGLVVLSRGGTEAYDLQSQGAVWASWSHDGSRLAIIGSGRRTVTVVDMSHPRAVTHDIAVHDGSLSECRWSPQDDYLACDDYQAGKRFILDVAKATAVGPLRLNPKDRYAMAWLREGGA